MAGSLNKVQLIGRLGNDPEIRATQDGKSICSFSVATSETWRDKNTNERKERTEWHKVVIFNENLSKIAEQYVKKGSQIYIEGQLQTRKWGEPGQERYTTEIVLQNFSGNLTLLGNASENSASMPSSSASPIQKSESNQISDTTVETIADEFDDEIPF
ncbi:MAG: single-stranded DNA-binding protein [Alphaproteobacteria bacterium]|uniref:Single-stranded DNA-binding protein n=1 Tax=PS1 clade bacterium TaxID=2175152 RepID=A0A368DLX2_9PROT|nr:single-stranded DNA-binding protein [Rhodobiaceae bacterium]OUT75595.1 MAG: single-stranded DNA-binding protein [Rhizobiales bacterium TMED25]RCL72837.1 MAG: single-stranded DNA-binding protein [PS1 clade bacterium]|tara:strand:- start:502 stop:975 length:474 start_codon:yes stop_codon:yes gene_type:complete